MCFIVKNVLDDLGVLANNVERTHVLLNHHRFNFQMTNVKNDITKFWYLRETFPFEI